MKAGNANAIVVSETKGKDLMMELTAPQDSITEVSRRQRIWV
jgi:hypothetical protein